MSYGITNWNEDYKTVIHCSSIKTNELHLFGGLEGEAEDRHGLVGCIQVILQPKGNDLSTTWYNAKTSLKTKHFNTARNEIMDFLRCWIQYLTAMGQWDYTSISNHPGVHILEGKGAGFKMVIAPYRFYILCTPETQGCDIYVFAYDDNYLWYELAGQHELPSMCFSVEPWTGALIRITKGNKGYIPCKATANLQMDKRKIVDIENAKLHVTRAQEAAMLNGARFGWGVESTKPWNFIPISGAPRRSLAQLVLLSTADRPF